MARCVVEKYFPNGHGGAAKQTVFIGSVVWIVHDRNKNALVVTILDDRYLLRDIRICGRWIIDPTQSGGPYFQQGWGAHFNPGGRPNLAFSTKGLPFFTPYPDWGLTDGEEPPDPDVRSTTAASYWTLESIFQYLWNVYSPTGIALQPDFFPWIQIAPESLIWPKEYASGLDKTITASFDVAIGQTNQNTGDARKGREVILEGLSLLDAMSMMLNTSGGYEIAIGPIASTDSNGVETLSNLLSIVPSRFLSKKNAVSIPMALSGTAANVLNRAVITGGTFEESSIDYKTAAAVAGQLIFIERMVSTKQADGAQIRRAWDGTTRWNLFRTLAAGGNVTINGQTVTGLGACSQASFNQALRIFPEVLSTWCLNESFDFQAGTDQTGFPRAPIKRPPWPTLLSVLGDACGYDFAGMHSPIYVEIETTPGHWDLFGQFDSAEILDNGIINLPLMREVTQSPRVWTFPGTPYAVTNGMIDLTVLNIRMALAIPCDHKLTFTYASPADGLSGALIYGDNPDADRVDPGLIRRDYRDCAGLYACWLRAGGVFTRPQTRGWPQDPDMPNSTGPALRTDYSLIDAHCRKAIVDVNRLVKGGRPRFDGYLVTTYAPGQQILNFVDIGGNGVAKPFPINACVTGYMLCCEKDRVYTELKFGAQ